MAAVQLPTIDVTPAQPVAPPPPPPTDVAASGPSDNQPDRAAVLAEAYKRGILPAPMKEAYEEAINRGLVAAPTTEAQPPKDSGMLRNVLAGANEGVYGMLGAPVDLTAAALNLGVKGVNAVTGSHIPTANNPIGGSHWIGEMAGKVSPAFDPATTAAGTPGEKIARGAAAGATAMLTPEAVVGALARAGILAPHMVERAAALFGRSETLPQAALSAGIGATSGAGAQVGEDVAPDSLKPLAGMVGGLVGGAGGIAAASIPAGARSAVRLAQEAAGPMTDQGVQNIAARRVQSAATDPQAVRDALNSPPETLIPGSNPTTFQATGDMGLGGLERGISTKFPEQFNQRRADQNTARLDALSGLQADGAPERVAQAVRDRMAAIDTETQAALDKATNAARTRSNAVGAGSTPEVAGSRMRDALEAAHANAKTQERALWDAVDPDGTLALPATQTKATAAAIQKELPASAKPPSGEEAAVYGVLGQYGDNVPFSELSAAHSRLKVAMRDEKTLHGDSPAYGRMARLNGAIFSDLENAVANKALVEQNAVAAGQMSPEDTMAANLQRSVDKWRQENRDQTGRAFSESTGVLGAGGTSAVRPRSGSQGASRAGFSDASGDPRLSANDANFDAAALDRLNAAREATLKNTATFGNRTIAPLLARPATTSPYNVSGAAVAGRLFTPGAGAYEKIQAYRTAAGPDAMQPVEDYAIDRLRAAAMKPDGTLDPGRLNSWHRAHADALRAFPDLAPRLTNAETASKAMMEAAARRKQILDDAQAGALGKIMGLDHPEDVTRTIGGLFARQDSVKQVSALRKAIGNDAEAAKGLRKAVADYIANRFVGNTEATTTGFGTVKSDQLQTFIRANRFALRAAGFTDAEVALMDRLAQDLQRSNRSIAAVKLPGGSNTAQDLLQVRKGDHPATMLTKILVGGGLGAGALVHGPIGAAVGVTIGRGADTALRSLREAGFESVDALVADALLNPDKMRLLLAHPTAKNEAATWQRLGALYRRAATTSAARSTDR